MTQAGSELPRPVKAMLEKLATSLTAAPDDGLDYVLRLIHGEWEKRHPGRGWQEIGQDAELREDERLAEAVSKLTALVLLQAPGDPDAAMTLLDKLAGDHEPDPARISQSAIRAAVAVHQETRG
ncbi:MAG: hypothetical protein JWN10_2081 [Solirubrobacterales bacterium]|nr:hypothetical protein [Solirubrobacterales bacterium]